MDVLRLERNDVDPTQDMPPLVGLDRLRVFAALGVVWLHACVPYLVRPMPGLDWPVRDRESLWLGISFWAIEVVIMPIFLVIAGILAWRSLQNRGPQALARTRLVRLGKPLLFGLLVVLPMDLYVWLGGWVYEGWIDPVKVKSLKIDGPLGDNLWGTSHLWFLVYLLTYIFCLAAGAHFVKRHADRPSVPYKLSGAWVPAGLLIVAIATLCVRPNVVWGFQHAFLPVPSKWIYSATFFMGGVWLAVKPNRLHVITRGCHSWMTLGLVFLTAAVLLGRWSLTGHDPQTREATSSVFALAVLTTVSAWSVTLAVIGISLRRKVETIPWMGYFAAASFWIYLVHHPLVGLIHIDLKYLLPNVTATIKGCLAFTLAVGTSLLTYESFVRNRWLGRWLGMQWQPPQESTVEGRVLKIPTTQPEVEVRRAA